MEELDFTSSRVVRYFRRKFIAEIRKRIKEIDAGSIDENLDSQIGSIDFSLSRLRVSDVTVPTEDFTIAFESRKIICTGDKVKKLAKKIRLKLDNIEVNLEQVDWSFSKEKFPKLKDSGKADVAARKVVIETVCALEGEYEELVKVKRLKIKIGTLDIKTSETKASVVYNLVLAGFKIAIKKVIKKLFTQIVTMILEERMMEIIDNGVQAKEKMDESKGDLKDSLKGKKDKEKKHKKKPSKSKDAHDDKETGPPKVFRVPSREQDSSQKPRISQSLASQSDGNILRVASDDIVTKDIRRPNAKKRHKRHASVGGEKLGHTLNSREHRRHVSQNEGKGAVFRVGGESEPLRSSKTEIYGSPNAHKLARSSPSPARNKTRVTYSAQ